MKRADDPDVDAAYFTGNLTHVKSEFFITVNLTCVLETRASKHGYLDLLPEDMGVPVLLSVGGGSGFLYGNTLH